MVAATITFSAVVGWQQRRRIAKLEALRGDWDREAHWIGVAVRGAERGAPGRAALEQWNEFPALKGR